MNERTGMSNISGRIMSVVFTNEENGYTVLRLDTGEGTAVTVTGVLPSAAVGESLNAWGTWMRHPSHGDQFKAEYGQRSLPHTEEGMYAYLCGGALKGIGPATASLIIARFGLRSFEIIESEPHKLSEIKGINGAKAQQISKDFKRRAGLRRLLDFMCTHKLRPILALKMHMKYGDASTELLKENPYLLAGSQIGGHFWEADQLALDLDMDSEGCERVQAAAVYELRHNAGNGHVFIPTDRLITATAQFINVSEETVAEALDALTDECELVREHIANVEACYLGQLFESERDSSKRLLDMIGDTSESVEDISGYIESIEEKNGMKYAKTQVEAIELSLRHKLMVLTGGPGTGKTTTIRAILDIYDKLGYKTTLAAPTGRAAKRMSEMTGRASSTVHRLLEAKLTEGSDEVVWGRDREEPLDCDVLVLDESSMVDITLMCALLDALPEGCRLLMVGDADQLPSVGPGNVFADVIRSEIVPVVRLSEIFRQSSGSAIVRNAHEIINGRVPNLKANEGDFFFLSRKTSEKVSETILELCSERLPKKMGIATEEIQVLSVTRKGDCGTVQLNKLLQERLNPSAKGKNEKNFGEIVFREGDRVMQIRNNYGIMWVNPGVDEGEGVFNGDMGYILGIDSSEETVTVDYDGKIAVYDFTQLTELEHAWAVTVHKAQGSEYRAVVLALAGAAPMLTTRSVLYTAVTRARELLVAVGDEDVASRMVENHRQTRRYSGLRARLSDGMGADNGNVNRRT